MPDPRPASPAPPDDPLTVPGAGGLSSAELDPVVAAVRSVIGLIEGTAVTRIRLRYGPLQLDVRSAAAGQGSGQPAAGDITAPARPQAAGLRITAPLLGVFYRQQAPGEAPFVEVGQRVEEGQQVAIVEAMKLMNPVVSPRAGVITEIHAGDSDMVEFEQILMTLEPV